MSSAWQFYFCTLFVFFGANLIAAWSLNLQFGFAGVMNFAFVVFQGVGAYTAAVVTLGPSEGSFQQYVFGATLPWPLPLLVAAVAGGAVAAILGFIVLRPSRRDYQAMVMLIMSVIAVIVVTAEVGLFNGSRGLSSIPKPLQSTVDLDLVGYAWFYVGLTALVCVAVGFLVHRFTASPWGRRLRAMRDNPMAATALGVNVPREQLTVFILGGAVAAISGALLVQFIGSWAPSSWTYAITFLYFTAIVVGGLGNNAGSALGVAIVMIVLVEGVRHMPDVSTSTVTFSLQHVLVGLVILAFLWFRPQGLLPERRRRFRRVDAGA